ncbi:hypothetical protein QL285_089041 [Trifolium repens]|nr:hypothetical protein QL285_089041 [Trifolium repens]
MNDTNKYEKTNQTPEKNIQLHTPPTTQTNQPPDTATPPTNQPSARTRNNTKGRCSNPNLKTQNQEAEQTATSFLQQKERRRAQEQTNRQRAKTHTEHPLKRPRNAGNRDSDNRTHLKQSTTVR